MKAEAKKMAIDNDTAEKLQEEENKKARMWKKDTLEKLSFLKDYGCEFDKEGAFRGKIYIYTKEHGTMEIKLQWSYTKVAGKSIVKYNLKEPLVIKYNTSSYNEFNLSLEEFVKGLVRCGIIKMED